MLICQGLSDKCIHRYIFDDTDQIHHKTSSNFGGRRSNGAFLKRTIGLCSALKPLGEFWRGREEMHLFNVWFFFFSGSKFKTGPSA